MKLVLSTTIMTNHKSRSSGILLHPTSLPGPFGVGDFGAEARAFVDFLACGGQRLWQVLPLGPTGYGHSPYQSLSAFAGGTLLIDPYQLVEDGLLAETDIVNTPIADDEVNFEGAQALKEPLFNQAYENFKSHARASLRSEFEAFCEQNSFWLDDYALFSALKQTYGGLDWINWDQSLARREPAALTQACQSLHDQIAALKFFQFLFFKQWQSLRGYCHERNIEIIGDLPIFVAYDSADVWAHRDYFKLDQDGKPIVVAGVPPDYFSETGQLWGNPIYDWERLRAEGFGWWIDRVRVAFEMFDLLRVDHFRGFAACWEIPAGDPTAENGEWVPAPGRELFAALTKNLGKLRIIAENLGVITPDVESLRDEFGFPGMRVLQFAFGSDATNVHLPHNYTRDTVAYTGTHDNDTTVGWFAKLDQKERDACLKYLATDGKEIHWEMIRAAYASVADIAMVPLQDVIGLGAEARMNLPASSSGNWLWQFRREQLDEDAAKRLRGMTELYGRG
jgi:4-alpha-glucanotransferase